MPRSIASRVGDAVAVPKRADLFVDPDLDTRPEPPTTGDDRALLPGFLAWQRETLALKCRGLDPDQLARRAVSPSTLSLLGLVRHMAEVERSWFRRKMAGLDAPRLYQTADQPDGDFDGAIADPQVVAEAWSTWREEIAFAEELVAAAADLDVTSPVDDPADRSFALRWVLIHMIEEYARHVGHADLLRERIDGALGQ
jgi:uncharacterized damage-inducible protein DinB